MNIVDYIIVGILFISAVHGWYIGFVLSFFNFAGYIIAGFVAKFYYQAAALWIANLTQIDENIKSFVNEKIGGQIVDSGLDSFQNGAENIHELPSQELNQMMENWPTALKNSLTENLNNLSDQMAEVILNLLGMVAVFIFVLIVIKILVAVLNTIAKIPGLKEINRGGGLILGVTKGALVILIGFAILTPFIGTNSNHVVSINILESQIGFWLYQHNFVIWLIKDYLLITLQLG